MRKKVSKFGKTVLASAIALGGLGVIQTVDPLKANANVMSDVNEGILTTYSSAAKNVFTAKVMASSMGNRLTDFKTRHTPTFTIHNTAGMTVQRGSLNQWYEVDEVPMYWGEYDTVTNISVAALPAGHYRIKINIPMDDGSFTPVNEPELTQAFTIQPDRSIVNIRP
ncbi:hypothetical protein [Bacillus xiapuensis]|uniref:hypothetical protein n=1 Tax=Bacillus xiapuensis TaxID=2014075 RepID=UPI000C23FBAB|nr:hypothetical protein [Bacillus xiapuensis]